MLASIPIDLPFCSEAQSDFSLFTSKAPNHRSILPLLPQSSEGEQGQPRPAMSQAKIMQDRNDILQAQAVCTYVRTYALK